MTFDETVEATIELLRKRGRVSYRALRRQFAVDDAFVDDLRSELVDVLGLAHDEGGTTLVSAQPDPSADPQTTSAPEAERVVGRPAGACAEQTGEGDAGAHARSVAVAPAANGHPERSRGGAAGAERRRLTVMFCDLVGSTELSERFDPELLGEIYAQWQDGVAETIARFGGHVADYRGDGVFVYFGFPAAYEDGPTRAVRASLAIVAMLAALNLKLDQTYGVTLRVRVGLHTGLVVLSDLGGKHAQQRFAFGETPNIAARIQALAEPDDVLVSRTIVTLSRGEFEFAFLGEQDLKGLSRPVGVYRALREIDPAAANENAAPRRTPLVARDAELGLLRRHLSLVLQGHGQAVLLSGEAGIGKSRLLAALAESAVASGAQRITMRCSAYHAASALHPIVDVLRRRSIAAGGATIDAQREQLATAFGIETERAATEAIFALLLELDAAPVALRGFTPQTLRTKTLDTIVEWIVNLATTQTLFLAIEDLHWADPSTLEVISLVIERLAGARIFLALTSRPEFSAPWPHRSYASHFMLGRLTDTDAEALVRAQLGVHDIPPEVVAQIVARADGVPLFLEEIVTSVLESGALGTHSIPETLHDSLMARLDRLADVRGTAQLAAVLGREFSYELIRAVDAGEAATLRNALAKLVANEYLQQRGSGATATYAFRHALMRDIAYESTLRSRRAHLHARTATILESEFAERLEGAPEIVAHHYTEGHEHERALPAWRAAAERAVGRSALHEALSHAQRGLLIADALPASALRTREMFALYVTRATALVALSGQGAPEVQHTYARALELSRELGDTRDLFFIRFGLWRFYLTRFDVVTATEIAEELFARAARLGDPDVLVAAHMALGFMLYHVGDYARATEIVEAGSELFATKLAGDPRRVGAFAGQNPAMGCLFCAAFLLWLRGRPDEAQRREAQAIAIARELDSPFQNACALIFRSMLRDLRGEAAYALADAEAAYAIATEHAFPLWLVLARLQRGAALTALDRIDEGLADIRASLDDMEVHHMLMFRTRANALLAAAALRAGNVAEGLRAIAQGRAIAPASGERWWLPELDRLEAELWLRGDAPDRARAESRLRDAVTRAESAGLVAFAQRATVALARLHVTSSLHGGTLDGPS